MPHIQQKVAIKDGYWALSMCSRGKRFGKYVEATTKTSEFVDRLRIFAVSELCGTYGVHVSGLGFDRGCRSTANVWDANT